MSHTNENGKVGNTNDQEIDISQWTQEDEVKVQLQTTLNGKLCIFPFKYDQKTYTACTLTDNVKPWCATGLDDEGFVVDDDWGECMENKEEDGNQMVGTDVIIDRVPKSIHTTDNEHETDTTQQLRDGNKGKDEIPISSNGKPCFFPFKYESEIFSDCTSKYSYNGVPWCATGIDLEGYVVDKEWGECRGRFENPNFSAKSTFEEFQINEINFQEEKSKELDSKLIKENDNDILDMETKYKIMASEFDDGLKMKRIASNEKPCIFPFKYDGLSYASCTIKDSENGEPWCATGIDDEGYVVDDDWGEC